MKADTECFNRVTFQGLCVFRTFFFFFSFFLVVVVGVPRLFCTSKVPSRGGRDEGTIVHRCFPSAPLDILANSYDLVLLHPKW